MLKWDIHVGYLKTAKSKLSFETRLACKTDGQK